MDTKTLISNNKMTQYDAFSRDTDVGGTGVDVDVDGGPAPVENLDLNTQATK